MPRRSFVNHAGGWSRLYISLEEAVAELPALAPHREQLGALVEEVYQRKSRLKLLQSQVKQEAKLLRDALERGKELESRIRSGLKAGLGPHSLSLERYGVKPVKRKRPVPAGGGAAPAPEPDAPPADATEP